MNQKKKSVSLVWAISRRNVVNGKYLHSTTKARGIDSLCFRSPSAPPLHSLTRGEATDHRFPTPLAFSTMPLVHDDDDEPVADAAQTETTSPGAVTYTHLRAHGDSEHSVCRLLLEHKELTS